MTEPYERLPRESSKAFSAFTTYLSLGPERSIGKAAMKCGKGATVLLRWSRRHDWIEQSRRYDARLVRGVEYRTRAPSRVLLLIQKRSRWFLRVGITLIRLWEPGSRNSAQALYGDRSSEATDSSSRSFRLMPQGAVKKKHDNKNDQ